MSFPKDQGGLLGALIPNVYVDTITLETGGEPPHLSNPHVEHEWETQKSRSTDAGSLRVTVDTSIKELISEEPISSWFGDKFARYVKFTVILSTNSAVTAALSSSNDGIDIVNNSYISPRKTAATTVLQNAFPGTNILDVITKHTQRKEFNIYTDAIEDGLSLTQHSSHVDDDGNIVHDVNFRAVFGITGEEPEHLAVFAVAHLDMNKLVDDYGLNIDDTTINSQNGKIASEVIIRGSQVVSQSFVFRKKDGKAWAGPVHDVGDGTWATEDSPTPESVPVTLDRVPNSKVQDFRNINKLERLSVDLSPLENEVYVAASNKFKYLKRDLSGHKPKNVYFSDLYLSRDNEGNARMSFAVDYLKMLEQNSSYEKLFSFASFQQRQEIISSCKIRSMRIIRRRITPTLTKNKLGNPETSEIVFDKNEAPLTVASSGEFSYGVFKNTSGRLGSLKESFYVLDEQEHPVRFFTATDQQVRNTTDGVYQYGVEMQIEDASQKYVYSLIKLLRNERKKLHSYYLESTKLGMSKFVIELQDPHIDSSWERARVKRGGTGNFSPASGRYTNAFIDEQEARYSSVSLAPPWVSPVSTYFQILNLFTGFSSDMSGTKIEELVGTISKLIAPRTGSPKGTMAVIKMIDNLVTKISLIAGSETPLGEGKSRLTSERSGEVEPGVEIISGHSTSSNLPTKTTTVSHWFSNSTFDSNVLKNHGWDYLSSSRQRQYSGLRLLTGEQYAARYEQETLRFFKSTDTPIDISGVTSGDSLINSGYGYLSPVAVEVGTTMIALAPNITQFAISGVRNDIISTDQYSSIEASITTATRFGAPVTMPLATDDTSLSSEAQIYQSSMLDYFSGLNMTIIPSLTAIATPLTDRVVVRELPAAAEECIEVSDTGNIDPVVSRVDEGTYEQNGMRNINANSLILQLQSELRMTGGYYDGSTSSAFSGTKINKVSASPSSSLNSTNMQVGVMSSYNVKSQANVVNWMYKTPEYLNEMAVQHMSKTNSMANVVMSFPNHIKSLLLGSTEPAAVVHDWHSLDYDPISDPRTSSQFLFLYGLINRVEVLTGYDSNIKEDVWEVLTYDLWFRLSGSEMLCRMRPYECTLFGIKRPKSVEMPIYDEYFIVTPRLRSTGGTVGTIGGILDATVVLNDFIIDAVSKGEPSVSTTNVVGKDKPTSASEPCGDLIKGFIING